MEALAKKSWASLVDFMLVCDTRYAEVLSGLLAFGWGLQIFRIPAAPASPQLTAMNAVAPLWAWGIFLFVLGAVQILGALFAWERFRRTAGIIAGPVWLFLFAVFALTAQWTGILAYGGFALVCSWVYLRLANRSPVIRWARRYLHLEGQVRE